MFECAAIGASAWLQQKIESAGVEKLARFLGSGIFDGRDRQHHEHAILGCFQNGEDVYPQNYPWREPEVKESAKTAMNQNSAFRADKRRRRACDWRARRESNPRPQASEACTLSS